VLIQSLVRSGVDPEKYVTFPLTILYIMVWI